ncbi:hypothetical protein [Clostridium sp.]|uniref:hypothetical protein n=1 Tax=Clostridium sp. TaxID=1506 RepID=UPI0025C2892C|nr:hypothetical protein [Clostridium sp.]
MYRYKLVNNDEFKISYKKYLKKKLLKGSLIIIGAVNLIIFILLFLFLKKMYKSQIIIFICIASIALVLESLIFYISYKKESKRIVNSIPNGEMNISFDEKGISLYQEDRLRHVKWQAVKEVIVDEDSLLLQFKVNGVPGNFFYFKFFDVQREELIKDIEKYIKVKGR